MEGEPPEPRTRETEENRPLLPRRESARTDCTDEQRRCAERLASLARMAGGIAHDFNNQLMAVLGALELLRERLDPRDGDALEFVVLAETAARKMARLTREMLVFSGGVRTERRPLELGALVHEVLDEWRRQHGRRIAWRVRTESDARAMGDPVLLREALGALLDNAVEALGARGGEVRVRAGRTQVDEARLEAAAGRADDAVPGPCAFIEVADDGPGIAPEVRAHLFEPFVTTRLLGRGLGLALVLGVMHTHAGAVEVESEPGRGARFRLLLPAGEG